MSRPSFEVADIIRIRGDSFRQRYSASLTGRSARCSMRSCVAVPLRSVVIAMHA
jgi:hypothetical protein